MPGRDANLSPRKEDRLCPYVRTYVRTYVHADPCPVCSLIWPAFFSPFPFLSAMLPLPLLAFAHLRKQLK